MTETPAIIPARGGSKGVPRKNLKLLGGKPLICWTIEQVLEVDGLVPYVSTEDTEIAHVSRSAGAVVIERPDDLAQDTTGSEPVVEHAIEVITTERGRPDQVMFLQATSPMRLPGTLERAVREFHDTGVDSMVGVVPTEIFVWQQHPEVRAHYPWQARPRRQDMTPDQLRYRETGSLYVTATEIYEREHNRLGGRIGLFVMDGSEGLDIDTLEDFDRAEYALAQQLAGH
ncbi:acylneuraminate cytidylyltransferase family protein [Yimella radicis]